MCQSLGNSLLPLPAERCIYRIQDLVATERRPTYLLVQWKAPPSPYSGSYLLTYGPLGGMTQYTMVIAPATSYNITGLQPFTSYMVTVQANNVPDGEFPLRLSEVFTTLPNVTLLAEEEPPTVVVTQFGVGSRAIVDIVIPPPTFNNSLRYGI